jgi:protein-tyrosine phosphatase
MTVPITETMWTWKLNWGQVRDDFVVGSCPMTPSDIDAIQAGTGATAILSVQCDECRSALRIDLKALIDHAGRRGLLLVNAPMRDFDVEDQRRRLVDAVVNLARLLSAGHRVYVHCTAGINRAPLTVLGYLTFVEGLSHGEALALVRAGRPQAEPYWEAWRGCRSDLVEQNRPAIEARAWDLSQRHPEARAPENWSRAEVEVIRERLLALAGSTGLRSGPNSGDAGPQVG